MRKWLRWLSTTTQKPGGSADYRASAWLVPSPLGTLVSVPDVRGRAGTVLQPFIWCCRVLTWDSPDFRLELLKAGDARFTAAAPNNSFNVKVYLTNLTAEE